MRGDAVQDSGVGGQRGLAEGCRIMALLSESGYPGRINQVGVKREVELDVARAGRDRIGHQCPLDRDRVRDKLR